MNIHTPFITLGILGSYAPSNVQYNVNTYIGQTFQDFELIFCFDKEQCIPVSDIIDSLNAHKFSIENRVKIFEEKDNIGLICNAMKVVEEANGNYIFFMSLEDAFYDNEALQRIYSALQNHPADINVFRTLVNHNDNWSIYPAPESEENTISICYPKDILRKWKKVQLNDPNNFALFQQELLKQLKESGNFVHYTDENTIAHICTEENMNLSDYYTFNDHWKSYVNAALSMPITDLNLELLSISHIQKLLRLLDIPDLTQKEIKREYYSVYRLASDSLWEMPNSIKYYLETLKYIASCLVSTGSKKYRLSLLKHKLLFRKRFKKTKLLFLAHEYSVWPSFQSVYEEAVQNKKFEAQLVYVLFFHEYSQTDHNRELSYYKNAGYQIISHQEYNLSKECPDVVFYVKPYDTIPSQYQVKDLRKIIETIVYIPYGMEIGDSKECLYYQCYGNMQYYADYIPAYSPYYLKKMQKYTYTKGRNYLPIGHPRIDLKQKNLPEAKEYINSILDRAKGRKIVLWNTHFTIAEGDNWGSFLIYGKSVLEYFKEHSDIFLLWRPHPLFYQALADNRNENIKETLKWLDNITHSENIILDRTSSYLPAFRASDAMISDWASMVPEYMAYERPVLVTPKTEHSRSVFSDAEGYFNIARTKDDIVRFIDNVRKNDACSSKKVNCRKILFFPSQKTVARELLNLLLCR